MGKVLRVLTIIVLFLGVGALVLAYINFSKREALIGRAHQLEDMFVNVAKTIESQDPADVPQPDYPRRDVSPVTSRELENPDVSAFWDTYEGKYETPAQPIPTVDLDTDAKRVQLRQLYRLDEVTGKPQIDPRTGRPAQTGKGTMYDLLDQTFTRAKAQTVVLAKTRAELAKIREELVTTIEDLNRVKKDGRADKKSIEDLNNRVSQLEGEKRDLERKIERLEEEKRDLNAQITEKAAEIERLTEDNKELDRRVKEQAAEIKRLKDISGGPVPVVGATGSWEGKLTPGVKGKVVSLNEQWKFVVIELNEAFMTELLGADRNQPMPQIELMVRRDGLTGASGDFVTRIKLRQAIRDQNLIVADILTDWQQVPVEMGDVVYF